MTGKGTTDGIFNIHSPSTGEVFGKEKRPWMTFIDLEKAFDIVSREVVWWALRKLMSVDELLVTATQAMHADISTMVKLNGRIS